MALSLLSPVPPMPNSPAGHHPQYESPSPGERRGRGVSSAIAPERAGRTYFSAASDRSSNDTRGRLLRSARTGALAGERLDQRRISVQIRLGGEAVHGRGRRPWQLLRGVDFDERHIPMMLVQHGAANIDEEIH